MLLLVKINGRIDMFFVKRKTSALPLLHLSSYHIIISCHAYACWCDEHQCVEHNVFGAPNFFSLFKKVVAPQAFYGSRAMLRFVNVHSHFIIIEFHITRLHAGIHWNFIKLKHLHHWQEICLQEQHGGLVTMLSICCQSTFQYWFNLVKNQQALAQNFSYWPLICNKIQAPI